MVETPHADRINRVLAAIDASLGREPSLQELAAIGAFSPFHFHRVFSAAMGETLHAYLLRKRLQRAALMLSHRPDLDVTAIAMESGFSSPSDFSRSFRRRFGASPKAYRASGGFRLEALARETGKPRRPGPASKPAEPRSERLEDERIAYITCMGVSLSMDTPKILRAFGRLYRWARSLGMEEGEMRFMGLLHDEAEIAPISRVRYRAALALPRDFRPPDRLSGDIALGEARLSGPCLGLGFDRADPAFASEYLASMEYLFKEWMPAHGLAPDDRPIVEVYSRSAEGAVRVEVKVPVRAY